jgi:hypothetical protein
VDVPQLRPLALGEILDVAIKIYRLHARTLLAIVFVVVAPVQVVAALVQSSAFPEAFTQPTFDPTPQPRPQPIDAGELWLAVAATLVVAVLTILAATIATGAAFKAVADAYLGERPEWRTSLRFAAARAHSIIWITILGGLLMVIGFVLCFVPGVYLWVAFAVAVPVLLMEGVKGRRALGRSRFLVRGRWWPTFGLLLLGYLLATVVTLVLVGLVEALAFADVAESSIAYLSLTTIANTIATTITTPFTAAFVAVLYFDLRVRKEAFDLQLLAERIGVAPDPSRPTLAPPLPPAGPDAAAWPPSGATARSSAPPYWPPPPGWQSAPADAAATGTAPSSDAPPDAPPYWPPPPGWAPPGPPEAEPPPDRPDRDR